MSASPIIEWSTIFDMLKEDKSIDVHINVEELLFNLLPPIVESDEMRNLADQILKLIKSSLKNKIKSKSTLALHNTGMNKSMASKMETDKSMVSKMETEKLLESISIPISQVISQSTSARTLSRAPQSASSVRASKPVSSVRAPQPVSSLASSSAKLPISSNKITSITKPSAISITPKISSTQSNIKKKERITYPYDDEADDDEADKEFRIKVCYAMKSNTESKKDGRISVDKNGFEIGHEEDTKRWKMSNGKRGRRRKDEEKDEEKEIDVNKKAKISKDDDKSRLFIKNDESAVDSESTISGVGDNVPVDECNAPAVDDGNVTVGDDGNEYNVPVGDEANIAEQSSDGVAIPESCSSTVLNSESSLNTVLNSEPSLNTVLNSEPCSSTALNPDDSNSNESYSVDAYNTDDIVDKLNDVSEKAYGEISEFDQDYINNMDPSNCNF